MAWKRFIIYLSIALCAKFANADIMVQLNINRPVNDVSDKFVSFTMKPEDLYEALDGSHRKSITRMASMLSHSHLKFVGDYYFATKKNTKLRNPTKIVWKGFNKWTRALDWTMVIPVPYTPNDWDPMHSLKILNNSQAVGITDCIWQLGTDFGTSAATDYVNELKTFNLMVDSFRDADNNWQIMGADISSGSSPDETRRYIEMSRNLNTAFGWVESPDTFLGNSLSAVLKEQDPALKVLFKEKVPVWLTLPENHNSLMMSMMDEELNEGLDWAQTMGDAAHGGFNTIFKHMSLSDLENPKFSFFVTALFKKIMGSRVFDAKPLTGLFGRNNKLYTHCANNVSGGLAFMVINKQEMTLTISVRSTTKLRDTELWKYALTMDDDRVLLNNKRVNINSTLLPEIKRKSGQSSVQLKTPGLSVTFFVLPNVNMEHCVFTEIEEENISNEPESEEIEVEKVKRYSSTDRLLKELIKEAARTPLGRNKKYRSRRSLDVVNERQKRFILEDTIAAGTEGLKTLADSIKLPENLRFPLKRDVFTPSKRKQAMEWLEKLFNEPLNMDLPLLRRTARNSDTYNGPFFMTRDGKKTAFVKKITEIKKPDKKLNKLTFDDLEFDEEKFFKNVGFQTEPDYIKIPEGDVFLQNIANINGDDLVDEELQIETGKQTRNLEKFKTNKDVVSEMKPLRLLPTEFYEALPQLSSSQPIMANNMNLGTSLNSLLFSENYNKPFGKDKVNVFENAEEFAQAQLKISEKNKESQNTDEDSSDEDSKEDEQSEASNKPKSTPFSNFMSGNIFGETNKNNKNGVDVDDADQSTTPNSHGLGNVKTKFDELPWWDLSPLRSKRSVDTETPTDPVHKNLVDHDDQPIGSASNLFPRRMRAFEHKVDEAVRSTRSETDNEIDSMGKKLMKTFKGQVSKIVDILSQHVNEWYSSLTKQLESSTNEIANEVYRKS
ncbi:uncharacterized protein LOC101898197 isoform X2 [Musca domestica]|uniref:Uncharacterized protein LOC101898197 isoform X2 n=1 Tax=Musca domestica TaxID=7370 RepID=A0ABM3VB24_MUSDO|nr:uncharacterized protein LOC101898197 isoform X2 [Musca domestica]